MGSPWTVSRRTRHPAMLRLTAARLLASEGDVAAAADRLLEVGAELGATSSVVRTPARWPRPVG